MEEIENITLTPPDKEFIRIARQAARILLGRPEIEPLHVVSIGKALYALDRLPEPTQRICVRFGVFLRAGDSSFEETHYIYFFINDDAFGINQGGGVYEKSIGSDHYSLPGYSVSLMDGAREIECDIDSIFDVFQELMKQGGNISVEDEFSDELPLECS